MFTLENIDYSNNIRNCRKGNWYIVVFLKKINGTKLKKIISETESKRRWKLLTHKRLLLGMFCEEEKETFM